PQVATEPLAELLRSALDETAADGRLPGGPTLHLARGLQAGSPANLARVGAREPAQRAVRDDVEVQLARRASEPPCGSIAEYAIELRTQTVRRELEGSHSPR